MLWKQQEVAKGYGVLSSATDIVYKFCPEVYKNHCFRISKSILLNATNGFLYN